MNLRNTNHKFVIVFSFIFLAEATFAQSPNGSSASSVLLWVVGIIILFALLFVGDSLLKLEAKNVDSKKKGVNYSILPRLGEIFGSKVPDFVPSDNLHVLQKGHDILLEGEAAARTDKHISHSTAFAVKPTDFFGIAPIPKLVIKIGDHVKAGEPLFYDKKTPEVKFCSPVSGEVIAINRGAKRSIAEVVVLADVDQVYQPIGRRDFGGMTREDWMSFLAESGVFPMIKRRPFQLIAHPSETPRDIFVSTFDSAPLAPNSNFIVKGREAAFQKGLDILNKLTDGSVYLGLNAKEEPVKAFSEAVGVEKHWFHGKHPAGNVGVQIHHIKPIKGQDVVWTLDTQAVITIGALVLEGKYNAERVVAITGAELKDPKYIRTFQGASVSNLLKDNLSEESDNIRIISGDVLSGKKIEINGFLGFNDDQITVVKEGNYHEMFGWLLPLAPRPSVSRTLPGFLMPNFKYTADTNTHGEERAFVVTGQYEKVLPMDIYPQHLMKSILMGDFERMEGLGINELAEEDVALCEFVCTSKQPLQEILRDGLDMMHEQG